MTDAPRNYSAEVAALCRHPLGAVAADALAAEARRGRLAAEALKAARPALDRVNPEAAAAIAAGVHAERVALAVTIRQVLDRFRAGDLPCFAAAGAPATRRWAA